MLTPGNTQLQHRKVSTSLLTACGLRSFCRPNVLCDQAFVCRVDAAADCTVVSPLTEVEAVRTLHGLWPLWTDCMPTRTSYDIRTGKQQAYSYNLESAVEL